MIAKVVQWRVFLPNLVHIMGNGTPLALSGMSSILMNFSPFSFLAFAELLRDQAPFNIYAKIDRLKIHYRDSCWIIIGLLVNFTHMSTSLGKDDYVHLKLNRICEVKLTRWEIFIPALMFMVGTYLKPKECIVSTNLGRFLSKVLNLIWIWEFT